MSPRRVVAITGCDSGLGWSIAARAAREGLVTVAGMYNGTETEASEALKKLCAHTYSLNVTETKSVNGFRDFVKNLIESNPGYRLYAVVNNAGVMTVGDYEWQTPSMIEHAVNVNLLGAMRVVTAFLPELRKTAMDEPSILKPRLVNIASHCGIHPIPGFAPYSISKAGLLALTKALRLEQARYGLGVTAFLPGGFVGFSNLMSNQLTQAETMLEHLNPEQKQVYEKRINSLSEHLKMAARETNFNSLRDEKIIETFMKTLLDEDPKLMYKVETNNRYKFYYFLMSLPLPETLHNWLVKKFLAFPDS